MRALVVITLIATTMLACAPSSSTPTSQPAEAPPRAAQPAPSRTLAAAIRLEPGFIVGRGFQPSSVTLGATLRLFNAGLVLVDDKDQPRPYLAEGLPTLNTDSWKVFDDGRMETVYKLRPNLTWHDGAPL